MSYGQKSNDELLQYFGFVEEENQADEYRSVASRIAEQLVVKRSNHYVHTYLYGLLFPMASCLSNFEVWEFLL